MSSLNRLLNLFRRSKLQREIDEELQFHIESRVRDSIAAGMSPEAAHHDACRRFGSEVVQKERTREANMLVWLETILQDARFGFRTLRKNSGVTIVAVLSLALGIGANTAIFSLINEVLLKNLPVSRPNELYALQPSGNGAFSYPGYKALRDQNQVFSDVFTFSAAGEGWNVIRDGKPQLTRAESVSGNYFSALGVNAIAGRALTPGDDQETASPAAVISYAYWQRNFNLAPAALGAKLEIDGVEFTIVGVAPPGFQGESVGYAPDIWAPIEMLPRMREEGSPFLKTKRAFWLIAIGRLRPGVSEEQARANMAVLLPMLREISGMPAQPGNADPDDFFHRIEMTPAGRGISDLREEFALPLKVLMIMVVLVLLIACANVANLLLSRSRARQTEIAIRLAVGGGRARLVRQLLIESVLLAIMGGALGLLFAFWGGNLLISVLQSGRTPISLSLELDHRALGFTIAVSCLTGLLFGIAPALRVTRIDPGPILKQNAGNLGGTKLALSKVLIVSQVAVSALLLIGAGLFMRTLQNLRGKDLGFDPTNVLVMRVEPNMAGYSGPKITSFYQQALAAINGIPGVRSASLSRFGLINAGFSDTEVTVPGYTLQSKQDGSAAFNMVSPRFFNTNGIALLAGREFDDRDTAESPTVYVVNESFARHYFGSENPIGKHIIEIDKPGEIVGLVRDAKYFRLRKESPMTAYAPMLQQPPQRLMEIEVRTAVNPASLASAVRLQLQTIARDVPIYGLRTQQQQVDTGLVQERLLAMLSGFFGALALLLTCIGLYGVMSYSVARRTNEIGLRMALGATQARIAGLFVRDAVLLVAIGLVIGIIVAHATTKVVSDLLFGLAPNDTVTIIAGALLLCAVSAIATWLPARRAARIDPLEALRCE